MLPHIHSHKHTELYKIFISSSTVIEQNIIVFMVLCGWAGTTRATKGFHYLCQCLIVCWGETVSRDVYGLYLIWKDLISVDKLNEKIESLWEQWTEVWWEQNVKGIKSPENLFSQSASYSELSFGYFTWEIFCTSLVSSMCFSMV